jgi:hypothetical protein
MGCDHHQRSEQTKEFGTAVNGGRTSSSIDRYANGYALCLCLAERAHAQGYCKELTCHAESSLHEPAAFTVHVPEVIEEAVYIDVIQ